MHEKEEWRGPTSLPAAGAVLADAALPGGLLGSVAPPMMAKITDMPCMIDEENPNMRSPGTGGVDSLHLPWGAPLASFLFGTGSLEFHQAVLGLLSS